MRTKRTHAIYTSRGNFFKVKVQKIKVNFRVWHDLLEISPDLPPSEKYILNLQVINHYIRLHSCVAP